MQWFKKLLLTLLILGIVALFFNEDIKAFLIDTVDAYEESYTQDKIGSAIPGDLQFYDRAGEAVTAADLFQESTWVMVFEPSCDACVTALRDAQSQQLTSINQHQLLFISFSDALPAQMMEAKSLRTYVSHAKQRNTAFSALLSPVFFRIERGIITQVNIGYSDETLMEGHHFSLQ